MTSYVDEDLHAIVANTCPSSSCSTKGSCRGIEHETAWNKLNIVLFDGIDVRCRCQRNSYIYTNERRLMKFSDGTETHLVNGYWQRLSGGINSSLGLFA